MENQNNPHEEKISTAKSFTFVDDPTVPNEMRIFYKKDKTFVKLILYVGAVLLGVCLLIDHENVLGHSIEALLLIPFGVFYGIKYF